jgi:Ala-tRNA(Pro) deacylase
MSGMLNKIRELLRKHDVQFREVSHEPTYTSEQSALARGESIKIGGKALLIKVGATFKLFVISAENRIDSKALKRRFNARNIRFAAKEELLEITGLVPGSVPPFGRPLLDFELYIDESIFENDRIAFNAGSLTDSIIMPVEDYSRVATHERFSFSSK